ncbi:MAG: SLC13 family permease [Oscillospiraceae bacterium]
MTKTKTQKSWYIDMAIVIAIYALFQFILPAPEPITRAGMGVAGIFIATLYLWIKVDIGWPSLLFVGVVGLTGVCSGTNLFAKTWGNVMVPFLVCAFMLNMVMSETGLTRRFALAFVTAKGNRGKPWRIMIMFFLAVLLMGLVSTSSAICVLFMAIAEEMFNMTGYKKGDRLVETTMIGIFWMAQGAMAFTPISHVLIPAIFNNILNDYGIEVTYGQFSLIFIFMGIFVFLGWILIFRFIIKPDVKKMANLDIDALKATLKPMSKQEWTILIVYGIVIIIWCFPSLIKMIPGCAAVGSWMASLGSGIPPMVACAVLCMIKYEDKPMLDYKDCCRRIPWGSVFMMTAVMGTAYIFGLEECGITQWLTNSLTPIMSGVSPTVFVIIVILFINIMTNCVSNTLTSSMYAVIMPIAAAVAGLNPIAVALLIAAGCNSAYALPSSCPAAGLASGAGWTRVGFQIKYGALLMVWTMVCYLCIAYPILLKVFPY